VPSDYNNVAVIGGGISGLTTATLLQLHGYKTRIYTRARLTSSRITSAKSPQFASLHAAASILAHSVASQKTTYWTNISQEYFRLFAFLARCGVREQTHFEIFEEPAKGTPDYWDSLHNVLKLTATEAASPYVPRRPGANVISGWTFDMFFCEAPEYIAFIHRLYTALGGEFVESTVGEGQRLIDYLRLDYGLYINCTGEAAIDFVNDAALQGYIDDLPGMPFYEPLRRFGFAYSRTLSASRH
jgi:glycine/D-amino acid oxidase-like deaminating enzyme